MPGIIRLDINDVYRAGNVQAAIIAWCDAHPEIAGNDELNCDDFALEAMKKGALGYVDALDGRIVRFQAVTEGTDPEDIHTDINGDQFVLGDWSDNSVVELICPSNEDVMRHPEVCAHMALEFKMKHCIESDEMAWRKLIFWMHTIVEAWEGITPEAPE